MNRSKEMIKLLKVAERRSTAIRMPWNHPKTKKYFFSFMWFLCYIVTFFTYPLYILYLFLFYLFNLLTIIIQFVFIKNFTMGKFPMFSLLLDACLVLHGILYIYVATFNPGYLIFN